MTTLMTRPASERVAGIPAIAALPVRRGGPPTARQTHYGMI
jgi:hypothetical protein